jgi:hypothetical protein
MRGQRPSAGRVLVTVIFFCRIAAAEPPQLQGTCWQIQFKGVAQEDKYQQALAEKHAARDLAVREGKLPPLTFEEQAHEEKSEKETFELLKAHHELIGKVFRTRIIQFLSGPPPRIEADWLSRARVLPQRPGAAQRVQNKYEGCYLDFDNTCSTRLTEVFDASEKTYRKKVDGNCVPFSADCAYMWLEIRPTMNPISDHDFTERLELEVKSVNGVAQMSGWGYTLLPMNPYPYWEIDATQLECGEAKKLAQTMTDAPVQIPSSTGSGSSTTTTVAEVTIGTALVAGLLYALRAAKVKGGGYDDLNRVQRGQCPKCGTIYNNVSFCVKDGAPLVPLP